MATKEIRVISDAAMWMEDGTPVAGYTPKVHRSELKGAVVTIDETIADTLIGNGDAEATS